MAKTYNVLTIDIKEDVFDIITAKQDDTMSRYLDVRLQDGGQPINLTGNEVKIYGRKADGKAFFNNGQITNATSGRCQFELTNQALAVAGIVKLEISIWQNNERILTTPTFGVHVLPKIRNDDAIESSNEFGALVVLYQKLYDFWMDVENVLGTTTDTGGSATEGSVMAKLNKILINNATQSGEIQYKVSNTIRETVTSEIKSDNTYNARIKKIYHFRAKYDGCIQVDATIDETYYNTDMYVIRSLHDDAINKSGSGVTRSLKDSGLIMLAKDSYLSAIDIAINDNTIYGMSKVGDKKGETVINTSVPVKKGEDVAFIAVASVGYSSTIKVTLNLRYDEVNLGLIEGDDT